METKEQEALINTVAELQKKGFYDSNFLSNKEAYYPDIRNFSNYRKSYMGDWDIPQEEHNHITVMEPHNYPKPKPRHTYIGSNLYPNREYVYTSVPVIEPQEKIVERECTWVVTQVLFLQGEEWLQYSICNNGVGMMKVSEQGKFLYCPYCGGKIKR